MNGTATLLIGPDGKRVIHHWIDWQATPILRYRVPSHATTKPPVLQQMWVRQGMDSMGAVAEHEECWQDVPRVVSDIPSNGT